MQASQMYRLSAKRAVSSAPCQTWRATSVFRFQYKRHGSAHRANASPEKEVYQGAYGAWAVEQEDVLEVYGYRAGISISALAVVLGTLSALLPEDSSMRGQLAANLDTITVVGSAALGVSLQLIHIYMAPLKRTLQVFWGVGTVSALYLMATQDTSAAAYVADHPVAMWFVGPLFAALTGVAFKEGLCYGKAEAGGMFGVIPLLMGGHLLQVWPDSWEHALLASWATLYAVFALRKFTQPIKDDIGDKSVFMYIKQQAELNKQ